MRFALEKKQIFTVLVLPPLQTFFKELDFCLII